MSTMRMTVKDLKESLENLKDDAEIILLTPWGHLMHLNRVDDAGTEVMLNGNEAFDCGGMPYW